MGEVNFQGLIIGLGNPGPQYRHTPHNFGFLALESFLEKPGGKWTAITSPTPKCDLWRGEPNGKKWLAAEPLTYMNLSGNAVGPLAVGTAYMPGLAVNKDKELLPGQIDDAIGGRHPNKTVNVAFSDGHVDRTKAETLAVEQTCDADEQTYRNRTPLWIPR